MEFEIESKLNTLLKYFSENDYENDDMTNFDIPETLVKKLGLRNYKEFVELVLILIDDKYVNATNDMVTSINMKRSEDVHIFGYINITTKGRLFLTQGGYIQKEKDAITKRTKNKKMEKNLFWLNFWVAFGAVVAALYYAMKFFLWLNYSQPL